MKATYIKITESEIFVNGITNEHKLTTSQQATFDEKFADSWIEVLNKEEVLQWFWINVFDTHNKPIPRERVGIFPAPLGVHYEVQEIEKLITGPFGTDTSDYKQYAIVSFSEAVEPVCPTCGEVPISDPLILTTSHDTTELIYNSSEAAEEEKEKPREITHLIYDLLLFVDDEGHLTEGFRTKDILKQLKLINPKKQ